MPFSTEGQSYPDIVSMRIQHYLRTVYECSRTKDSLRRLLKALVSDHQMQPILKQMIKDQLSAYPKQKQGSLEDKLLQIKAIRHRIKKKIIGLVRHQLSKFEVRQAAKADLNQQRVSSEKNSSQYFVDVDAEDSFLHNQQNSLRQKNLNQQPSDSSNHSRHRRYQRLFKQKQQSFKKQQSKGNEDYSRQKSLLRGIQEKSPQKIIDALRSRNGANSKKEEGLWRINQMDPAKKGENKGKFLTILPASRLRSASPLQKTSQFGHFQYGDMIDRILDCKPGSDPQEQTLLIEWLPRKDGLKPAPSMLSISDFRYFRPTQANLFREWRLRYT